MYVAITTFFIMSRRPTRSPLFPYTTLFRSVLAKARTLGDAAGLVAGRDVRSVAESVGGIVHVADDERLGAPLPAPRDRKSTRLNSSHPSISYAVFCLKKKKPPSNA